MPSVLNKMRPYLALALLVAAEPASAHIPQLRGRLLDLVAHSDVVVVGTVETASPLDPRTNSTTIRTETALVGEAPAPTLTFRGAARFPVGSRFVFFLRRNGSFECVQPSGTLFAARPQDDAAYRVTVTGIKLAQREPADKQPAALRTALIPALSAGVPTLRYHAVLELAALAHHGLSDTDRQALARIAADPSTDATIRPIIKTLLDRPPAGSSSAAAAGQK